MRGLIPLKDPEARKIYNAAYYASHRAEKKANSAAYRASHRAEARAYDAAYRASHRAEKRAYERPTEHRTGPR